MDPIIRPLFMLAGVLWGGAVMAQQTETTPTQSAANSPQSAANSPQSATGTTKPESAVHRGTRDAVSPQAEPSTFIMDRLQTELRKTWPKNRTLRFVFHGHSIPAGYFDSPTIRRFDSYPLLFQKSICELFPTAAIDVSITAIGGENSESGAARFDDDVMSLRPDVLFIDYSMNDRRIGLPRAEQAWESMIRRALADDVLVILLTSSPTSKEDILDDSSPLAMQAKQIRGLAERHGVLLVDAYAEFQRLVREGNDVQSYLSHPVHPNRRGHEVMAELSLKPFE